MWKSVYDSVQGTSHKEAGTPCQDACRLYESGKSEQSYLVAVCSDGAGSASHSDLGASAACDYFVRAFDGQLPDNFDDPKGTHNVIKRVCEGIRLELATLAQELQIELRDLACTLLAAIVLDTYAVFLQIGDGAIVVRNDAGYEPVFWPQSGEYKNETNFLSQANYVDKLEIERVEGFVDEFAIFTDGMEDLALRTSDQSAHTPFFLRLFNSLRSATDETELFEPLRQWLDSDVVNERTNDDKTLILATRYLAKRDPDGAVL
jgi:hypothetical protein